MLQFQSPLDPLDYVNIYWIMIYIPVHQVAMAEWLRRWTRNPMGFSRAGSNPARDDLDIFVYRYIRVVFYFVLSTLLI